MKEEMESGAEGLRGPLRPEDPRLPSDDQPRALGGDSTDDRSLLAKAIGRKHFAYSQYVNRLHGAAGS